VKYEHIQEEGQRDAFVQNKLASLEQTHLNIALELEYEEAHAGANKEQVKALQERLAAVEDQLTAARKVGKKLST
jgi:hypothetical protein